MNQSPNADRDDDRLIGRDRPQRSPIQMVEVRVGDEHEIDRRQMMDAKAGLFQAFDHAEPHRPNRVDQYICVVRLNQERSMANPGNTNLAWLNVRKKGARIAGARSFREERWNPNTGNEIALGPLASGTQFHALGFFGAALLRVANYPALS